MPPRDGFEPRTGFAFAERETAAARKRIASDLATIVGTASRADPHLVALVLTGGFSRGEGTVRDGAPVNDYDLVAVRSAPGGASLHRRLGHELSDRVGLEVDLMPVWRARLPHVGRKLFWLDARLGGRVVGGDEGVLSLLPAFGPAEVSRTEIARLLGNRAAGLLLALPGPDEPVDARQRDLQATKAALAAMDATLLARGEYAPRLRDRLALAEGHPDHALFARAVEWKLGEGASMPDEWWDECAAALLRAVDATGARAMADGLVEHALYFARARRLRFGPSRAVRLAAWDLLAQCSFPGGPCDPDRAAAVLRRLGPPSAAREWPALRARFFALRAMTLQ